MKDGKTAGTVSYRTIYLVLVFLRLAFALFGTGYIHPDEYFQNGEVVAGRTLRLHNVLTWEWDPIFPCRSIVPVWITSGLPMLLVRTLSRGEYIEPRMIFAAERLSFLCLSFVLDYAVYNLVYEPSRVIALTLLSSSYVVFTYQVRPFSNSLEAILVALSLVVVRRLFVSESLKSLGSANRKYLMLLSFLVLSGLFTRITFGAFFLPVALEVLKWSLRQSRFSLGPFIRMIIPPSLVAMLTGIGFVYADSTYFTTSAREASFELTPLNFLRYNLLPANLAEHGLHPRWLHLVVNLPMIATPALLFYVLWAEWDYTNPRTEKRPSEKDKRKRGIMEAMQKVLYWVRWSATTLLSIQPHQEPRFLIPLITPMIALAVNNGRILRAGRTFWLLWVASNAILGLLFGVLHQGGVIPSLFRLHDILHDGANGIHTRDFHVVYWKTYMPPRHLLAVRQSDVDSKAVAVYDRAGSPPHLVIQSLQHPPASAKPQCRLLVAPFYAMQGFDEKTRSCFTVRDQLFPHLDLDHIAETIEVGLKEGLTLGIFETDVDCLSHAASTATM